MDSETRMTINGGVYMQSRSKDTFENGMGNTEVVIKRCLAAFPWMWVSCRLLTTRRGLVTPNPGSIRCVWMNEPISQSEHYGQCRM